MSTPPRPPLEGQQTATTGPKDAERPMPELSVGEPKGVAEGVPKALGSHPHPTEGGIHA